MTSACVDLSQDRAPRCALAAAEIPLCTPLLSAPAWAGRGQREGGGGHLDGEHGNQDTRAGNCLKAKRGKKNNNLQPASGTESCYQIQVSVSGTGTPPAFDAVTAFAFVFVSLTSCQLNSSVTQQTSLLSLVKYVDQCMYLFVCFLLLFDSCRNCILLIPDRGESTPVQLTQSDTHPLYHNVLKCQESHPPREVP